MINPIKYLIISALALLMFSCSDGSQVGVKINELIKRHKITKLIIENECTGSDVQRIEYEIKKIKIEQQFIRIDEEYFNMGKIKTVKVEGKELKILL